MTAPQSVSPGSADDRKFMGAATDAKLALIEKSRIWRELRQPSMDTAAGHRKTEAREHEARFQLANAALLWLWHEENPEPLAVAQAAQPSQGAGNGEAVADLIERMELFADHGCSPSDMGTAQELVGDALQELRRLAAPQPTTAGYTGQETDSAGLEEIIADLRRDKLSMRGALERIAYFPFLGKRDWHAIRDIAKDGLALPSTQPLPPDWKQDQAETSRLPRSGK